MKYLLNNYIPLCTAAVIIQVVNTVSCKKIVTTLFRTFDIPRLTRIYMEKSNVLSFIIKRRYNKKVWFIHSYSSARRMNGLENSSGTRLTECIASIGQIGLTLFSPQ